MHQVLFTFIVGMGTTFGPPASDRHNVGTLACLRRPMRDDDVVVAHRTLPCRSPVVVCLPRTGRCVLAQVGDRGPLHAEVDLSRELARQLGHNGREDVVLILPPGTLTPKCPPVRSVPRV